MKSLAACLVLAPGLVWAIDETDVRDAIGTAVAAAGCSAGSLASCVNYGWSDIPYNYRYYGIILVSVLGALILCCIIDRVFSILKAAWCCVSCCANGARSLVPDGEGEEETSDGEEDEVEEEEDIEEGQQEEKQPKKKQKKKGRRGGSHPPRRWQT